MVEWTTSCLDWADRIKVGRSIIPPPIFSAQAEEALAVFKELKIVDAPGSPTFGESCAPWVFDLMASIFGAYDPDSGRRLITERYVMLPKKNSKSTIAAGIMMTALILNWRQSGKHTVIAPTIEVAGNAFFPWPGTWGNAPAIRAASLLLATLGIVIWATNLDDFAKATITLICGRALGWVEQIFSFEFGTTRTSTQKDDTINNFMK